MILLIALGVSESYMDPLNNLELLHYMQSKTKTCYPLH